MSSSQSRFELQHALEQRQMKLREGAVRVQLLTERLDRFLLQIEEWLEKLPGRVDTIAILDDPDKDGQDFYLRLTRVGQSWRLMCKWVHSKPNPAIRQSDWVPVREASIHTKMQVADAIPLLIDRMGVAQADLVHKLEVCTSKLGTLAASFGIGPKGGM